MKPGSAPFFPNAFLNLEIALVSASSHTNTPLPDDFENFFAHRYLAGTCRQPLGLVSGRQAGVSGDGFHGAEPWDTRWLPMVGTFISRGLKTGAISG
jgi:hypothetical protein